MKQSSLIVVNRSHNFIKLNFEKYAKESTKAPVKREKWLIHGHV